MSNKSYKISHRDLQYLQGFFPQKAAKTEEQ